MAELAFEAVARLAIIVIVFSLLVGFIYTLYNNAKASVETQGLLKMDMAHFPPQALREVVERCRALGGVKEKSCAILLNVGEEDRDYLASLGVEIKQRGSTALLVYENGEVILK